MTDGPVPPIYCSFCGNYPVGVTHTCTVNEPAIDFDAIRKDTEARRYAAQVNASKLESCPGPHRFDGPAAARGKQLCSVCGGELWQLEVSWYERGLEHGRRQMGGGK